MHTLLSVASATDDQVPALHAIQVVPDKKYPGTHWVHEIDGVYTEGEAGHEPDETTHPEPWIQELGAEDAATLPFEEKH